MRATKKVLAVRLLTLLSGLVTPLVLNFSLFFFFPHDWVTHSHGSNFKNRKARQEPISPSPEPCVPWPVVTGCAQNVFPIRFKPL